MKRTWLWWGGGVLAAALVAGAVFFAFFFTKQAPEMKQEITVKQLSPQMKERLELEAAAYSRFAQKAGELRYTKLERTAQGWSVVVEATGNEKDLHEVTEAAKQLFHQLQETGVELADATAVFRTDALLDAYGRRLTGLAVAKMVFSGQSMQKIVWDDVPPQNLPGLADFFWQHPLLPTSRQ